MDFYEFMDLVCKEWEKTERSEAQLARAIGMNPATFNAYKNRMRGVPQSARIKKLFIDYFKDTHPEVYEILGVPRPVDPYQVLTQAGVPDGFARAVMAAHSEYIEEIKSRGISTGSPEAEEINKIVLAKHGIFFTDTE